MTGKLIAFIDAERHGSKLVSRQLPTGGSVIIRSEHQGEPRFELEVSAGNWGLTCDVGRDVRRVLAEGTYSSESVDVRPTSDPYAELGRLAVEMFDCDPRHWGNVFPAAMLVAIRRIRSQAQVEAEHAGMATTIDHLKGVTP